MIPVPQEVTGLAASIHRKDLQTEPDMYSALGAASEPLTTSRVNSHEASHASGHGHETIHTVFAR